jgi:hypothetical protein
MVSEHEATARALDPALAGQQLWRQLGAVPLENRWTWDRAAAWWREHLPDLAAPSVGADSGDVTLAHPTVAVSKPL